MYDIYNDHLPIEFSMALSHNRKAFYGFLRMDDEKQDVLIEKARNIKSHREMQELVNGIADTVGRIPL